MNIRHWQQFGCDITMAGPDETTGDMVSLNINPRINRATLTCTVELPPGSDHAAIMGTIMALIRRTLIARDEQQGRLDL
jgi:hypothetical protein